MIYEMTRTGLVQRKELLRLLENDVSKIDIMVLHIVNAFKKGGKVVLFGNGGSMAEAQHIAAELYDYPVVVLDNVSAVTAIGNDYGYDDVFTKQIAGLVREGDIVIALSTSGNSVNVIRGIGKAKALGACTIGLCGAQGRLNTLADYVLEVPSMNTQLVQEMHLMIGHIMCDGIKNMYRIGV